jgi:hypothetical protein
MAIFYATHHCFDNATSFDYSDFKDLFNSFRKPIWTRYDPSTLDPYIQKN